MVKLNPNWITGFVDAEGCFYIRLYKNEKYYKNTGWGIQACFQINLNYKDLDLLYQIKNFFNDKGSIYTSKNSCIYQIRDILSITNTIIPHFNNYPLITQKYNDFILFRTIINIINVNKHLTNEGLLQIVSLKSSLNKGLSSNIKKHFPNIKMAERKVYVNNTIINKDWIGGFFSGEGCFLFEGKSLTVGIAQHYRDESLMIRLRNTLECGVVSQIPKNKHSLLRIRKLDDILNKIIPLFDNNQIKGVKSFNFRDFCLIAKLMKLKAHLNPKGLILILKIKQNMNKGRKFLRKDCHWQDEVSTKYCALHLGVRFTFFPKRWGRIV